MVDRMLPWLRRTLLLAVFVILVISPLLQLLRVARQDPFPFSESPIIQNNISRQLLLSSDHFLRNAIDPVYKDISGGPFAIKVFPVTFSEPLSIATNAVNRTFDLSGWNTTMIASLAIAIGLMFFFGRVYCGYVCPMSVFSSWNQKIQRKLFNRTFPWSGSLKPKLSKTRNRIFLGLLFLFTTAYPVLLQYILPPALFQNAISDYLLLGGGALWLLLIGLLVFFELGLPGYFCRILCPTGSFLSFFGAWKKVHLAHPKGVRCPANCSNCLSDCWLGLDPKGKIENSACDLCARCASNCPANRIRFSSGVLVFALIFGSYGHVEAGIFDSKEDYHQSISERTYFEGEFKTKSKKGILLQGFYSFWGNSGVSKSKSGSMYLYIHILNEKEIFSRPITIDEFKDGKKIKRTELETVTHPISIGQRSLYQLEFEFQERANYRFKVSSPAKDFESLDLSFQYPKFRL